MKFLERDLWGVNQVIRDDYIKLPCDDGWLIVQSVMFNDGDYGCYVARSNELKYLFGGYKENKKLYFAPTQTSVQRQEFLRNVEEAVLFATYIVPIYNDLLPENTRPKRYARAIKKFNLPNWDKKFIDIVMEGAWEFVCDWTVNNELVYHTLSGCDTEKIVASVFGFLRERGYDSVFPARETPWLYSERKQTSGLKIGYIQERGPSEGQCAAGQFKYIEDEFVREISNEGDLIRTNKFQPVDYEEVLNNTILMKKEPNSILIQEPFLVDSSLSERVMRWVDWANQADASEYDPSLIDSDKLKVGYIDQCFWNYEDDTTKHFVLNERDVRLDLTPGGRVSIPYCGLYEYNSLVKTTRKLKQTKSMDVILEPFILDDGLRDKAEQIVNHANTALMFPMKSSK